MWVAFVTDNSVHGRGFSGQLKINFYNKYFLLIKAVLSFDNHQRLSQLRTADYYTSCGGYYSENGSILTSPGFPGTYAYDLNCAYSILAPEYNIIELRFSNMDIQGNADGSNCPNDYLSVRDGEGF